MSIHKTKDYDIFKKIKGNRPIENSHVRSLINSIVKENCLHLHPIIVNKNMEVIDGQHRLHAAIELGVEIYYVKDDNVSMDHLGQCNMNQRKWGIGDFVNLYSVRDKKKDFIIFRNYMKTTKLHIKAAYHLFLGSSHGDCMKKFQDGSFCFAEGSRHEFLEREFINFMKFVDEKGIRPRHSFTSNTFTISFRRLVLSDDYNSARFFDRLKDKWHEITPQPNCKAWLLLLLEIYNYRMRGERLLVDDVQEL